MVIGFSIKTLFFLVIIFGSTAFEKIGHSESSTTSNQQLNISIGYTTFSGNNDNESKLLDLNYNYNQLWDFEWTAKAMLVQSSIAQNSFNYQRFQLRYGKSLNQQWYYFWAGGLELNQQSQLDQRNEARLGSGYWFADSPDWQLAFEISTGGMAEKYKNVAEQNLAIYSLGNYLFKKLTSSLELSEEWLSTRKNQAWLHRLNLNLLNTITTHWKWGIHYEFIWDDSTPALLLPWEQRLNFLINYDI